MDTFYDWLLFLKILAICQYSSMCSGKPMIEYVEGMNRLWDTHEIRFKDGGDNGTLVVISV